MPILHRYLLKNYLRVLFLSVSSFIALLLISQLEEIAQFAAMGAKPSYLALFTLYQIPYILPIALPISCLISSLVLFQQLSRTHELTALRSCGIALKAVLAPILILAAFLSLFTFYIASELATSSHLATRKMVYELSSVNPLLLLQSAKIARLQEAFIQMDPVHNGKRVKEVVIALNQGKEERIHLCLIKQIELQKEQLVAHQVSLLSSLPSEKWDHLVIENQNKMVSSASEFAQLLHKSSWRMANDYLKLKLLRIRTAALKAQAMQDKAEAVQRKEQSQALNKCLSEYVRRFSLGLAAFTFTFLGAAFGIEICRNRNLRGLIAVLLLSSFCLIAFCMGKASAHSLWLSSCLYLAPHLLLLSASFWTLNRIHKGIA